MNFEKISDKTISEWVAAHQPYDAKKPKTDLMLRVERHARFVRSEAERRGLIPSPVPTGQYTALRCDACHVIDAGFVVYQNTTTGQLDCICNHCGERAKTGV
jgi:hypothetical protein